MISPSDSNTQGPLVTSNEARFVDADAERQRKDKASDGRTQQDGQADFSSSSAAHDAAAAAVDPATIVQTGKTEPLTFAYAQLARQLEYYFSEKNLSKDTYLQTLRQLNDGCVPVSILANFAMVKGLVMSLTFVIDEEGRLAAVEEAARNHSDRLMVCMIDTKTGLRVTAESDLNSDSSHRIPAVGTTDGKPLTLDTTIPQPSPIVKTIILRDVVSDVTPEDIYELFNVEGFPPVTSIQPDVANCWFVSIDTDDKNVMLDVLLSLRSMNLRDHPVHARLKSTVVSSAVDTAPVMPWAPPMIGAVGEPVKRRKKKNRGKKKKAFAAAASKKGKKESTKASAPPPPTLGEENFPILQDKTVEWDTTSVVVGKGQQRRGSNFSEVEDFEDEEDRNEKGDDLEDDKDERKSVKAMSDGASTATTTSSSLESVVKKTLPKVGYAAALMGKSDLGSESEAPVAVVDSKAEVTKVPEDQPLSTSLSLSLNSHGWGGRRSFAEILRVSQDSSASTSS